MRAPRWALCGSLMLAAGCVTHRGAWQSTPTTESAAAGLVDLVVVSGLAPGGGTGSTVAKRVTEAVGTGRQPILIWLGDRAASPLRSAMPAAVRRGPRCTDPSERLTNPALAPMFAAAEALHAQGKSVAARGVLDRRCDEPRPEAPWTVPAAHYVMQVFADGDTRIRTRCEQGACSVDEPDPPRAAPPLVELVVIDLAPWIEPRSDTAGRRSDDLDVLALDLLLEELTQSRPDAPPRLLVSTVPVEAAAEHGLGTLWPDATFHNLPPSLQTAIDGGVFAGAIAAYDRSQSLTPDLSNAIKRADRAWLSAPMFQVQVGAMSKANTRPAIALRRRRIRRSQAFAAPTFSDHAGFAVVRLGASEATAMLHAYRYGRWETTEATLPLQPVPHPDRTASPHMGPCRDCPPIPATER